MKKLVLLLSATVLLYSCKHKPEDIIAKKWHATELSSPQMDQMMVEQQQFLDTFGKNSDAASNKLAYGVEDVDSMRRSLQLQMNDFKAMQEHAVKNTWFDIRKNGVAVMNFSGQIDSANWYFDDEKNLVLDEMKLKGTGAKLIMEVVELADTSMKLRFTEDGVTSAVTFHPEK
ncbi:MAG: hypothetical protein EOP51_19855 [Sphingobacteriales bacterium]|nr:MAG: hypothetical protein EOP51_19855 [Sphingobacteriales bacterium]